MWASSAPAAAPQTTPAAGRSTGRSTAPGGSAAPPADGPEGGWPRAGGAEQPAARAWEADDDYDDDDDDEPRRHPYTWLHLLVLAIVAFVLGFLIMLLLINRQDDGSGAAEALGAWAALTTVLT